MINIKFPFYAPKRTSFILAAEEYLAANIKDFDSEELVFTWESKSLSKTDNKGLKYLGKGCFGVSYISPLAETQFANMKYVSLMGLIARKAGVEDAFTDGEFIKTQSGAIAQSSYYGTGKSSVMHSALFFDANLDKVRNAIGIDAAVFKDHGCALSMKELQEYIIKLICPESKRLNYSQIREIIKIENGK